MMNGKEVSWGMGGSLTGREVRNQQNPERMKLHGNRVAAKVCSIVSCASLNILNGEGQ